MIKKPYHLLEILIIYGTSKSPLLFGKHWLECKSRSEAVPWRGRLLGGASDVRLPFQGTFGFYDRVPFIKEPYRSLKGSLRGSFKGLGDPITCWFGCYTAALYNYACSGPVNF